LAATCCSPSTSTPLKPPWLERLLTMPALLTRSTPLVRVTYSSPLPFKARPYGDEVRAKMLPAGPAAGLKRNTMLLELLATYSLPLASNASPCGERRPAKSCSTVLSGPRTTTRPSAA
jgi:hypothetical protein